ncbi:MAG: NAD-dependent epimerase/dehydratase family protein [Burkholderiales bacterium]|nr:NAD-dependent epimerase/dehydratase family protein [Anaerolineae bacterium]
MKYFITGATGFVGGHVARQLIEGGHVVIALARNPAKASDLTALGVTVVPGDITDKASMREPMTGVDGVFHVAAWYEVGLKDSSMAYRINVEGTRNVLELMRELNVPKGVYTSTLAVFSDTDGKVVDESYRYAGGANGHNSEYDRTKWLAHYEVALPMMREGLPLVIVQPGVVYGPGDASAMGETVRDYLRGKLPMVPQKAAYAWGYIDDIAHAHILAMDKGKAGETYIIAGPVHTFIEALDIAQKVTGIPPSRLHPSPTMMKATAAMMSAINRIVPLTGMFHPETLRSIAGATYIGSNAKARRELGYAPRSLEEGFRQTLPQEMVKLGIAAKPS